MATSGPSKNRSFGPHTTYDWDRERHRVEDRVPLPLVGERKFLAVDLLD
jgi:hypothetical protein